MSEVPEEREPNADEPVPDAPPEEQQRPRRLDDLGDELLDDYQRRRQRLEDDLTGELPNDSPESA